MRSLSLDLLVIGHRSSGAGAPERGNMGIRVEEILRDGLICS